MGDFYGNIIDWNLLAGLNGYLFTSTDIVTSRECLMGITSFIATMKNMIFRCSRENKNKRNVQPTQLHVSLLSVNLY